MKQKRYWWVSRNRGTDGYKMWLTKPTLIEGYYFGGLGEKWFCTEFFEAQTNITLQPGECKRIENPWWKAAQRKSDRCLKCGRRLAMGTALGELDWVPDDEPYKSGVPEPVMSYGNDVAEVTVNVEILGFVCPHCEKLQSGDLI